MTTLVMLTAVPNAPTAAFRAVVYHEERRWDEAALAALDCMHHMRPAKLRASMFGLAADYYAKARKTRKLEEA